MGFRSQKHSPPPSPRKGHHAPSSKYLQPRPRFYFFFGISRVVRWLAPEGRRGGVEGVRFRGVSFGDGTDMTSKR